MEVIVPALSHPYMSTDGQGSSHSSMLQSSGLPDY
jgi:hypothetical protein